VPGVIPAPPPPTQNLAPPASTGSIPPRGPTLQSLPPAASPGTSVPSVPSGQVALAVSARFGRDLPPIAAALHWRIYPAKPEPGAFRPVKEERAASPTFALPAGGYVVHVGFGLASATKLITLRAGEPVR